MTDIVADIITYENGEMDQDEMVAFFQRLVDSGMAWQLQGHYGRTVSSLIENGLVTPPGATPPVCVGCGD